MRKEKEKMGLNGWVNYNEKLFSNDFNHFSKKRKKKN